MNCESASHFFLFSKKKIDKQIYPINLEIIILLKGVLWKIIDKWLRCKTHVTISPLFITNVVSVISLLLIKWIENTNWLESSRNSLIILVKKLRDLLSSVYSSNLVYNLVNFYQKLFSRLISIYVKYCTLVNTITYKRTKHFFSLSKVYLLHIPIEPIFRSIEFVPKKFSKFGAYDNV